MKKDFLYKSYGLNVGNKSFKRKYENFTNIKNEISMTMYNFFLEPELQKTARKVKQEAYFK